VKALVPFASERFAAFHLREKKRSPIIVPTTERICGNRQTACTAGSRSSSECRQPKPRGTGQASAAGSHWSNVARSPSSQSAGIAPRSMV